MLNKDILLTIKHYNGSTYTNLKTILGQPDRDTSTITLDTDHYLYVGFYKPIKQFYFDITTPNTNSNNMSFEYYNGTEFTDLEAIDDTSNFTRSGLIQWDEKSDWEANEIDSLSKYWVRISTDSIHTEAVYNFLGLIFADDRSLIVQNPYILNTQLLMGESNHLKAHVSARDHIIQEMASKGYLKTDSDLNKQAITPWDMLEIAEIRQAAVFKALSVIYFNLSDDVEDAWMNKSEKYDNKYMKAMSLISLSIDSDDDGITDDSERKTSGGVSKLIR